MMDWTDRHCRVFHRLMTRRTRLYTEMLTTGAILHPIRRTADVEVDFVITKILADFRAGCEVAWIGAAELKRNRMFAGIESEQPPSIAMDDGASRQHLRVEPRAPRHQTVEDAARPVGPVHHRGNGKSSIQGIHLIDLTHSIDRVKDWAD